MLDADTKRKEIEELTEVGPSFLYIVNALCVRQALDKATMDKSEAEQKLVDVNKRNMQLISVGKRYRNECSELITSCILAGVQLPALTAETLKKARAVSDVSIYRRNGFTVFPTTCVQVAEQHRRLDLLPKEGTPIPAGILSAAAVGSPGGLGESPSTAAGADGGKDDAEQLRIELRKLRQLLEDKEAQVTTLKSILEQTGKKLKETQGKLREIAIVRVAKAYSKNIVRAQRRATLSRRSSIKYVPQRRASMSSYCWRRHRCRKKYNV